MNKNPTNMLTQTQIMDALNRRHSPEKQRPAIRGTCSHCRAWGDLVPMLPVHWPASVSDIFISLILMWWTLRI